jgi:hypothetical protein
MIHTEITDYHTESLNPICYLTFHFGVTYVRWFFRVSSVSYFHSDYMYAFK